MRFLLAFLIVFSSLAFSVEAQTRRATARKKFTPVKRINEAPQSPPVKAPETSLGAVIEKFVTDYYLNADGTGTQVRTMQQRCLSEACVARLGLYKHIFNGNLQRIKVLDAYILKADGTQLKIPASAVTDRPTDQAEAAPGFSSLRELEVKLEGMKAGDAAYLKIESVTTRPTFDGRFDGLDIFPLYYDWKSIEVNVSAPADYPLFIEAVGLDGGKLADENGRSLWKYKKGDIAKIAIEPAMEDVASISPRFALTTFADIDALGAAFWENVKQKAIITPEIQRLADEITKDASTPVAQASAIYDWANKNIRYLSIVLDRGGWIPHSSVEIVKNGYGDCKDYTTIIHTLLRAKGIDSIPVLIRADLGNWFPSVAAAGFFNHAILYIPSIDMFADATTPNTRLGLFPQELVGKRAVLAGQKTGIIQLPKDNPNDNQILSDLSLDFSENGTVTARSKNTFLGRSEILFRPIFTSADVKRESGVFVRLMLAYYGLEGEGSIVNIGNPHKVGEPFNVEIESRIANFTTFIPKGRLQIPAGLNLISMASMEALASTESRKTSIIVGAIKVRENVSVSVPVTVKIATLPLAVNFANAIGSFKVASEMKGQTLAYSRELIITKDVIESKDYPQFKELVKKLVESSELEVEYAADAALLRAKSKELRTSPAKARVSGQMDIFDELYKPKLPVKLTAARLRQMEKKLMTDPGDVETRTMLIRHYARSGYTPQAETAQVKHRVWLIANRPEIDDETLYGWSRQEYSAASTELLTSAWLAKVSDPKTSAAVRMNAVRSMKSYAPAAAMSTAEQGAKLEPENYELLLLITEINAGELNKATTAEQGDNAARKILEYGKRALALIKKERSDERDADRAVLLKQLCAGALRFGDLDSASSFAQELVLDFGQSSNARIYDEAAHVGNTTLGLVELRRNNIEKAKEHLMASIRAPLRMGYNNLSKIETRLVSELYDRAEKAAVLEYIKLCLDIPNFKVYPESYADEVKALKLWQEQIGKGIKPSFDFKKP